MSGWNYYLLSNLPLPGALGAIPPLTVGEFLDAIKDNESALVLCRALALGEDLLLRESLRSGERKKLKFMVLNVPKEGEPVPLPDCLQSRIEHLSSVKGLSECDLTRSAYYDYLFSTARDNHSLFLRSWVGYVVGLRNALAVARADLLGWEEKQHVLNEDLADDEYDFSGIINEWQQSSTPLAGFKLVERARWGWLIQNENWFTFSNDEIAVYCAKLLALWRWHRLVEPEGQHLASRAA